MKKFKRFIPIIIILILMIIFFIFIGFDFLSFENLKKYRNFLLSFLDKHNILAPILFILSYIIVTALSIPGAIFLTLLGGFLFKQPFSTLYVLIGASIGAGILFLAAKTAFRDFFQKKAGKLMKKISSEIKNHAMCYLLFLRLVPAFPFWFVNVFPAFFDIRFRTFILTTFFGIMPGTFIFTQAGAGLGSILDSSTEFTLRSIFTFQITLVLIVFAVLSLIPVIFKKIKKKIC
ncbi:MAG: hypothetical protein K1060chlam5_00748 [Candidatus Anoxychlamydiales bacterium]|nr:hypothetical protein [Candidatus Anoxychlamydiales bacterium]